jgi:hypothetical protein
MLFRFLILYRREVLMNRREVERAETISSLAHVLRCKECGEFRCICRSGLVCLKCCAKIEPVERATRRSLCRYFGQFRIE